MSDACATHAVPEAERLRRIAELRQLVREGVVAHSNCPCGCGEGLIKYQRDDPRLPEWLRGPLVVH